METPYRLLPDGPLCSNTYFILFLELTGLSHLNVHNINLKMSLT